MKRVNKHVGRYFSFLSSHFAMFTGGGGIRGKWNAATSRVHPKQRKTTTKTKRKENRVMGMLLHILVLFAILRTANCDKSRLRNTAAGDLQLDTLGEGDSGVKTREYIGRKDRHLMNVKRNPNVFQGGIAWPGREAGKGSNTGGKEQRLWRCDNFSILSTARQVTKNLLSFLHKKIQEKDTRIHTGTLSMQSK